MRIKREDIDNRKVDFSNIASDRRLPPEHPGEILRDEFPTPMKISVYELANTIKVSRARANDIVLGRWFHMRAAHATACNPFLATNESSLSEAPRGCFSPRSHWLTSPVVTLR